jgi:cytochrome c oxidase assembly protein subunit 15
MAAVLVVVLVMFALTVWRERRTSALLKGTAAAMLAVLALQVALGISVIWTLRDAYYTTAHVIAGAGTLAVTFLLTWFCYRNPIETRGRQEPGA